MSANLYDIYWHISFLCVQWKTPDDGRTKCPKHVEFYSKNKFEKLLYLVGFIIRIYHVALSSECHILKIVSVRLSLLPPPSTAPWQQVSTPTCDFFTHWCLFYAVRKAADVSRVFMRVQITLVCNSQSIFGINVLLLELYHSYGLNAAWNCKLTCFK